VVLGHVPPLTGVRGNAGIEASAKLAREANNDSPSSPQTPPNEGSAKSNGKAAPLPSGFLEAELSQHKRKIKLAEHTILTLNAEVASLHGKLSAAVEEARVLRESLRGSHEAERSR
jgi:hypothetical protein